MVHCSESTGCDSPAQLLASTGVEVPAAVWTQVTVRVWEPVPQVVEQAPQAEVCQA